MTDTSIQYKCYLSLFRVDTFIRRTTSFSPSFIWLSILGGLLCKTDTPIQYKCYLTLYKVDTFIGWTPPFSPSFIWPFMRWTPLLEGHLYPVRVLFDSLWEGHLCKGDTSIQCEFYLSLYKVDTFIRRAPPFSLSFIWLSIRWIPL